MIYYHMIMVAEVVLGPPSDVNRNGTNQHHHKPVVMEEWRNREF